MRPAHGRSSLSIGEALGSSVERPVPGCAVLGNADAEPGCVVSCDADAEAIQGGFTGGGGSCKASRNLVLAPSSSCEKATWKAFRASLCDAAMVKRENLSYA